MMCKMMCETMCEVIPKKSAVSAEAAARDFTDSGQSSHKGEKKDFSFPAESDTIANAPVISKYASDGMALQNRRGSL